MVTGREESTEQVAQCGYQPNEQICSDDAVLRWQVREGVLGLRGENVVLKLKSFK